VPTPKPSGIPNRDATVRRIEQAVGTLTTQTITQMEAKLPWFRAMPAENRSWVSLVARAGIAGFVEWLKHPERRQQLTGEVFGLAPRELARAVTLRQTVEMVRVTIDVVEQAAEGLAAVGDRDWIREAVLVYAREVAFAAAQVYAQAAESRGAWDARLEALVVDALLRGDRDADDSLRSRAAALGWRSSGPVTVVIGSPPDDEPEAVVEGVRRAARQCGFDVLAGVQGDRLVVVLGDVSDGLAAATALESHFGPGPVVVGPVVADLLAASRSARAAITALQAAAAWPAAPRPASAADLLPESALAGDSHARRQLVEEVYSPLLKAGNGLLETVATYLDHGASLEATARALYVHPNTVRYRLRRATEVTGYTATEPRERFTLQIALALGRLAEQEGTL
jgi:hypothetical protein